MPRKRFSTPVSVEKKEKDEKIEADWKVENVVATVTLTLKGEDAKMDLNNLARKYNDTEYNPERFPGLVMRVEDPKATVLIFSTGKMVITGMREAAEAGAITSHVVKLLKKARMPIVSGPEITIQNIVASGDLHVPVNLNEAAILMENVMYEPEVFPGLIYRMQEPKTVFLIFSTGRIVCTGAKTREAVAEAIEALANEVATRKVTLRDQEDMEEDFAFF